MSSVDSVLDLPYECLVEILAYLSARELLDCAAVCSAMRSCVATDYLWRNLCRMDYCPVTALGMWLTMTGIREGPIFRVVNKNDKITDTPCSPNVYGKYMKLIFIAAGLPDRTTHSLRHTAMGWFARCHISELMRRAAGRWAKTSTAFNGYATRGVIIREEHVRTGKMDPIFKFWAARAPVFTASK